MNRTDEINNLGIFRAMDANVNRATEGLRVVEDFCRFLLNDHYLCECTKRLRHRIVSAVSSDLSRKFACQRDAGSDVGAQIQTETEYERTESASLVQANIKRAQQAIRSLEEFAKTFDSTLAEKIERIRYEAYSVETALTATLSGKERIGDASVYVLVDASTSTADFTSRVRQIVAAGVDVLQLRSKSSDDCELIARSRIIQTAIRDARERPLFIVNDRADIAKITNADGVHLGQTDVSVAQARTILGCDFLVGVSTHSIEQARTAVSDGANYIGVGPVFPSSTKSFNDFPGLDFVSLVAKELSVPAFAIGGIDTENVERIIENGIRRVAVSNAVWNSADPTATIEKLKQRLGATTC